jgi:lipopolysaccharide exporter
MLAGEAIGSGVTAALVQRREATSSHLESGMALGVVLGLGAGAAIYLGAPLTEPLFGQDVVDLAQLGSLYFPLIGVAATSAAILQRGLSFSRIAAIEVAGVLAGLAMSIALAAGGMDAEALVLGAIVGQALSTIALLATAPPPRPRRRPAEMAELLRFGVPNAAAAAASVGARNVDYAVLAARAPAASVGYYWRGYQLGVEIPRRFGSSILGQLALPLYARADDARHRLQMRSRMVQLHTLLMVPPLILLIVLAPVLVPALFGERWEPAVTPTQLLAGVGILSTALAGVGPLMSAIGRPRALLHWNLGNVVVVGIAVFIAAPHGLTAVCATVLGVRIVRYFAAYVFLLNRLAGVRISEAWRDPGPALVAGGVMAAGLVALQAMVLAELPPALEVTLVALTAAPLYLGALTLLFPGSTADLRSGVRRLLRPGGEGHDPSAAQVSAP